MARWRPTRASEAERFCCLPPLALLHAQKYSLRSAHLNSLSPRARVAASFMLRCKHGAHTRCVASSDAHCNNWVTRNKNFTQRRQEEQIKPPRTPRCSRNFARVRAAHSNSSQWRFAPKTKHQTLGVLGGSTSYLSSSCLRVRVFLLRLPWSLALIFGGEAALGLGPASAQQHKSAVARAG